MDAMFFQYPFYGSQQLARHLPREGAALGRRRVSRLGHEAINRQPRASGADPDYRVQPNSPRWLTPKSSLSPENRHYVMASVNTGAIIVAPRA